MIKPKLMWLASWPRSGNTFLRTILWQCFGLNSASIYTDDLESNEALESYVGHVTQNVLFAQGRIPLIKIHKYPPDDSPAIYVVRNGVAATISLWQFYKGVISMDDLIEGRHQFGTWTEHLQAWRPWERPNTLLLKYEDLVNDLPGTLNKISGFLDVKVLNAVVPPRDAIASVGGQHVNAENIAKPIFSASQLKRFTEINAEMQKKLGYSF